MTDGLSGAVHHRKMAQATTLTSITYVSPVLLLSVVVPHFHPYAGGGVFLFVVMPQICPCVWARCWFGPSLARLLRFWPGFPQINRAKGFFCLIFPKNEAFDLWFSTPFEYNSGGDALPSGDHSKKYEK